MGRDFPSAPEPTIWVNKTALNICMATEGFSTLQIPWVVPPLVHWVLKTTHNPHTQSASESVCLTGYCRHQPDSREEKQEMTLTRIEASCAQGEPFLAPQSSNPSTGLSL